MAQPKDRAFLYHVERVRAATSRKFTMTMLPEWISKHTKILGRAYSFKDHEYQEVILRDQAQEVVVRKCSQVGLSEMSARMALALSNVIDGYTVIYTLPTATFAAQFVQARVDPVIQSSDYLSNAIDKNQDNTSVKRFGHSFTHFKGAASSNAPISVPADHLIHDEVDFSSPEVLSQYQSRLTHSRYKRKTKLSTPTFPDYGIDYEFQRSKRKFNMVKCNHCAQWFLPDYYEHVRVPGSPGLDLRAITKVNLHKFRYQDAYVACPYCGLDASLQHEHRQWVVENSEDNFLASGYQVSPFDAPNIITASYLIQASTQYKKRSDFDNFNLGIPADDKESTLGKEELQNAIIDAADGSFAYVMGLDMGLECHCVIAKVDGFQQMIICHTEVIPLATVVVRRKELARQFRVRMTVVDSQPYTETVLRMQASDPNLFGAIYANAPKRLDLYWLKEEEEDRSLGMNELRQVNINRNRALDNVMDSIRSGELVKEHDDNDELWVKHLRDMKRVKQYDDSNEMFYAWVKSSAAEDHFHHATLYAKTAAQIMGRSRNVIVIPMGIRRFEVEER